MKNCRKILEQSAQFIKGVGPKKNKLLNKLNIFIILDMFYYFPRRYEDRSKFCPINRVIIGSPQTIKGRVIALNNRRTKRGLQIFNLIVTDGTGVIYGTWFNQPYLKKSFRIDDEVILHGKIEKFLNLQINSPEYEILKNDEEDETIHTGRIVPIYPLTHELSQRYLRSIAKRCLDKYINYIDEFLPSEIKQRYQLINLKEAVYNIHFPKRLELIEPARRRLIFDEFFFLELTLAMKKQDIKENGRGIQFDCQDSLIREFIKALPFKLTPSQELVIDEIKQDMESTKSMNRLLQGDVGSGKTVISIWAMVIAVQNKYQAALMAPTEILAEQHYQTTCLFLKGLPIKIALLTSALDKRQKLKLLQDIKTQQIDIIIGTQALIQEEVNFSKLGLVVIDEQHKFGVMQRIKLQKKAQVPDVLVMTATPIPRTLAITIYGELDVSTIKELPPGRTPVKTYWIKENKRNDLYKFLRQKMTEKNQIYVVYPIIEASKMKDLKAATRMYELFKNKIFPEFQVGLLHGRIKEKNRQEIMELFKSGKLDILVATTVIEVGIDVPNASIMLIEHAERFGLGQLHQLRGRVGRGQRQAYCIVMADDKTTEAQKRLQALTQTNDGFKISEYDLMIRGPGEFFGTRQHGLPELKIGNILQDKNILIPARREAFSLLDKNPLLSGKAGALIKEKIIERFPQNRELILVR